MEKKENEKNGIKWCIEGWETAAEIFQKANEGSFYNYEV